VSSPSEGIRIILENANVGKFNDATDWNINIDNEPDSPDRCITIYDTGGQPSNPRWLVNYPNVQIRVRGNQAEYVQTYAKAEEVKNALLGILSQTINGENWVSVSQIGDINSIGKDANRRPLLTLNFALIIEPNSGTYRESL